MMAKGAPGERSTFTDPALMVRYALNLLEPKNWEDVTLEGPKAGELRIKMGATGVCHSDLSVINGTLPLPAGIDWICLSPKGRNPVVVERASEIKLVFPQPDGEPERWADFPAEHHFLQPLDDASAEANLRAAAGYCLDHPQWRLSLQTHKLIGIR